MQTEDLSRRTTVNIQEKANLIWAIADKLVGTYKPHEYGKVILPFTVLKRFDDALKDTKQAVVEACFMFEVFSVLFEENLVWEKVLLILFFIEFEY